MGDGYHTHLFTPTANDFFLPREGESPESDTAVLMASVIKTLY